MSRALFRPSSLGRQAVAAVRADGLFRTAFTGYNAIVRVMVRTSVRVGALTQTVRVHFVQEFLPLTYCKQSARFLSLASNSLEQNSLFKFQRYVYIFLIFLISTDYVNLLAILTLFATVILYNFFVPFDLTSLHESFKFQREMVRILHTGSLRSTCTYRNFRSRVILRRKRHKNARM